jgi:hypothetical protein
MEGVFQLLVIAVFLLVSLLDLAARKKKREALEDEQPAAVEGGEAEAKPRTPPSPRPRPVPVSSPEPAPAQMEDVQDLSLRDVWEIITGRKALPTPEGAPSPGARAERPAAPETRRSARWMEGLEEETSGEPERPTLAGTRVRPVLEPPPGSSSMEEPWGELEDITRGEIGDGRGAVQGALELEGAVRVGASRSPYVRLLTSGKREDLRAAVVLQEVLGPPVGSRGDQESSLPAPP